MFILKHMNTRHIFRQNTHSYDTNSHAHSKNGNTAITVTNDHTMSNVSFLDHGLTKYYCLTNITETDISKQAQIEQTYEKH